MFPAIFFYSNILTQPCTSIYYPETTFAYFIVFIENNLLFIYKEIPHPIFIFIFHIIKNIFLFIALLHILVFIIFILINFFTKFTLFIICLLYIFFTVVTDFWTNCKELYLFAYILFDIFS